MGEFDVDAGVQSIADSLGLNPETPEATEAPEAKPPETAAPTAAPAPAEAPAARAVPKSWAKDYHEPWTKIDPKVQEYIELREKQMLDGLNQYRDHNDLGKAMREVFSPYKQLLEQQGIDEIKAAQYLMGAHARLMTMPQEQKLGYLQSIARNYGVEFSGQPDQALSAIQQRINQIEHAVTSREQREFDVAKSKIESEVTAFADAKDEAGNPKHPYFNDVAEDIVAQINAGKSLQDAYKSAVWSNPVTREKELARIRTDAEANLRAKSKTEVEAARKAKAANVRSRDTTNAPTEPLGKMEDTMRETLADIKARAH